MGSAEPASCRGTWAILKDWVIAGKVKGRTLGRESDMILDLED